MADKRPVQMTGRTFDPDGYVDIVGLDGLRRASLGAGGLMQVDHGIWRGDDFMFNSRGVQVTSKGVIVRPPVAMAVNPS